MVKFNKDELLGALMVVGAGMCWGTTGTTQALTPPGASSLTIGAARLVAAGILLALINLIRCRGAAFSRKGLNRGVFIAAAAIVLYQFSFFSGVRLTGVAIGTMIAIGSSPAMAGIMGALVFGERLSKRWFCATFLAVAGCSLLVLTGNADASVKVSVLGVFLSLGAGLAYALEGLGLRLAGSGGQSDTITLVSVIGALLALPVLIFGDCSWIAVPRGALAVLTLAVISTIVPFFLFTAGLHRVTMGKAYTLSLSEPMTAWLLSTVILGERISFTGMVGITVLFAGIVLLACESKKD